MVVYLVTSIFETEPGQFKKYTMAYDSLDAALEYVELDMASQYEGIYKEVLTDDIKEMVRMREDFFFKYGQMPHYIMIERLDVLSALPENVDNVVRFSLTEHMIEPVEEEAEEEEEEESSEEEEESPEEDFEFSAPVVPEENMNEISSAETENESPESMMNEESVESPTENMDSDINGLEEEEELMPSPETFVADNSESNMGNSNIESNIPSEAEVGENMNTSASAPAPAPAPESASAESNIPAALRTATGGKRRTRRKAEKGKNKSRKA